MGLAELCLQVWEKSERIKCLCVREKICALFKVLIDGYCFCLFCCGQLFVDLRSDILIPNDYVTQGRLVGAGAFGDVYQAQLNMPNSNQVKTLS